MSPFDKADEMITVLEYRVKFEASLSILQSLNTALKHQKRMKLVKAKYPGHSVSSRFPSKWGETGGS